MKSDSIDVRYVAKLARIALSEEEVAQFERQLADLLEHVAVLEQLDTGSVPATAQVIASTNVMRDDEIAPSLDREEVLRMAPQRQGPFFRVPRIIA